MAKRETTKDIHLYPAKGIAYIHTQRGVKIISIKQLLKDRILNKFEIGFIKSNKLYYKNSDDETVAMEIPKNIKIFIIFKNKKVYPFGIVNNKIVIFHKMPNLIREKEFLSVCFNNYIPKSINDAIDKFVSMPFTREISFEYTDVKIEDFLEWLAK
jgi:hypothetical protein